LAKKGTFENATCSGESGASKYFAQFIVDSLFGNIADAGQDEISSAFRLAIALRCACVGLALGILAAYAT
jgi:hypothetical protein